MKMKGTAPLVVGVASAREEDPVLALAAGLAQARGAELHVAHAYSLPEPMMDAYARLGYLTRDMHERYGESIREAILAQAGRHMDPGAVTVHLGSESPARLLSRVASEQGAPFVVVGGSGRGAVARHLFGGGAESVVRDAEVPVLVLRDTLPERGGRVLLTTDLSGESAAALTRALPLVDLLAGDDAELAVLLVVWYDVHLPPPLRPEMLREVAEEELRTFLAANLPGRQFATLVRTGDYSGCIAGEALSRDADLVVMGTRGGSGKVHRLLGSVAGGVLRRLPGNALVIPAAVRSAPGAKETSPEG
jgi:nucleotide-binding universal stress UspA family protein